MCNFRIVSENLFCNNCKLQFTIFTNCRIELMLSLLAEWFRYFPSIVNLSLSDNAQFYIHQSQIGKLVPSYAKGVPLTSSFWKLLTAKSFFLVFLVYENSGKASTTEMFFL
jgi:hypothetical protein